MTSYRKGGEDHGYFSYEAGRAVRARAHLAARAPVLLLQLSRLVQRRHPVPAAGVRLLHPRRRRLDGLDPQLVQGGGLHLQGRLRRRPEPLPDPLLEGAAVLRWHGLRPGLLHARGRRLRGHDQVRRRHPSRGQDGRPRRRPPRHRGIRRDQGQARRTIRGLRDAGFDMDLGGPDITSVQYQNANNSVRVTDEFMRAVEEGTEFGLRARGTGEVIETVDARSCSPRSARPPGPAPTRVCSTTTPSTTGTPTPRRADHRVEPVLGVHVAGQLLVQPRVAEPVEVPQGRRHLRRRTVRPGGRGDHHRDGHLDLLRGLPDRVDRPDHP